MSVLKKTTMDAVFERITDFLTNALTDTPRSAYTKNPLTQNG
jgi:hypothetical protein